jgi:hypothetical protein
VYIRAFVLPAELSQNGYRDEIYSSFWLKTESWCHSLQLIPPTIADFQYEVWEPTKSMNFNEFQISWPW